MIDYSCLMIVISTIGLSICVATVSLLGALGIGILMIRKCPPFLVSVFLLSAQFLYVIPPFIVAAFIFLSLQSLNFLSLIGFQAILIAHCFVFVPYASSILFPLLNQFYQGPKQAYLEIIGLKALASFRMLLRYDLKAPLISLWIRLFLLTCLSFSLVVYLGDRAFETVVQKLYDVFELGVISMDILWICIGYFSCVWSITSMASNHPQSHVLGTNNVRNHLPIKLKLRRFGYPKPHVMEMIKALKIIVLFGLILLCLAPVLSVFYQAQLQCQMQNNITRAFLTLAPAARSTLINCTLIAGGIMLGVLLVISMCLDGYMNAKRVLKRADFCAAIPKLGFVMAVFLIMTTFKDIPTNELRYGLMFMVFFLCYWGYGFRYFYPHVQEFQTTYGHYCDQLNLRTFKRLQLFMRLYKKMIISLYAEFLCFCIGNLTIVLFLSAPSAHGGSSHLSVTAFDAMMDHNVDRATACFLWILILLFVASLLNSIQKIHWNPNAFINALLKRWRYVTH